MPITGLETTGIGHGNCFLVGKWYADPGIAGSGVHFRSTLHLEFEQATRPQEPMHFPDIAPDHFAARNVLEYDEREREVDLNIAQNRQIRAAVLEHMRVGTIRQRLAGLTDHFAADIDGVHLTENLRQGARNAAGAAADLEHRHLLRIFSLADVSHVGENLAANVLAPRFEIFLVVPVQFARGHVMAGILARTLVTLAPHFAV